MIKYMYIGTFYMYKLFCAFCIKLYNLRYGSISITDLFPSLRPSPTSPPSHFFVPSHLKSPHCIFLYYLLYLAVPYIRGTYAYRQCTFWTKMILFFLCQEPVVANNATASTVVFIAPGPPNPPITQVIIILSTIIISVHPVHDKTLHNVRAILGQILPVQYGYLQR